MSDNSNPTYEAPTITITGYDDAGRPVIKGHEQDCGEGRRIDIPEPPITLEDTGRFDLIEIEPEQLRGWRGSLESIAASLRNIGWDSSADMLELIGDQISKRLGDRNA